MSSINNYKKDRLKRDIIVYLKYKNKIFKQFPSFITYLYKVTYIFYHVNEFYKKLDSSIQQFTIGNTTKRSSITYNTIKTSSYLLDTKQLKYRLPCDFPILKSASGMTKHITFLCFRHTFATLQIALRTDIYTVSKMLTHKNISTIQIYADLVNAKKRESANKINLK